MKENCTIEIFSANCPLCVDAIELVKKIARSDCEIQVLNMNEESVLQRAKKLGISRVPAIVIDGEIAECCQGKAPSESILRASGIA